jgi:hypothetical protein
MTISITSTVEARKVVMKMAALTLSPYPIDGGDGW